MAEPTLSEITSIKAEPSLNPGVVLEGGADRVRELNQSAQFNAELKQRQYSESMGRLKDIYQDIGQVQGMEIMSEDKPLLAKKLGDIYKEIGTDPRAALAGAKYGDIEKKLGEARSLATQSKQDNIAHTYTQRYLESDPDLQTPENMSIVNGFPKGKLGARKFPLLQMPPSFDVDKAANNIMNMKGVASPFSESGLSEDNKFINKSEGVQYDRGAFLQKWNSGYNANPNIQKWSDNLFNKIKDDPTQLGAYADPQTGEVPKNGMELYQNAGKWQFNKGQAENIRDVKKTGQTVNPYEFLNKKQKFSLIMEGLKTNDRMKINAASKDLVNKPVPQNAAFLVKTYATVIQPSGGASQTIALPGGQRVTEQPINNLSNTILKQFVENQKTSIKSGSSLGASELISSGKDPDLTTRTADGGIRLTFYKRWKEGDRNKPMNVNVGDPVKDENGSFVGENTQVIPARLVLTTLAPSLISKPLIGQTVETAADFISGKSLDKIDATITPERVEQETLHEPSKTVPSGTKQYNYKGKTYSEDQVNQAAKNLGMTKEAYIKKYGLK
jgi:hypothetical protein